MPIMFQSLLLYFCDFPPLKRCFTQLHDMWREFDQVPLQRLHGYSGANLVSISWVVWGNDIFFFNNVVLQHQQPLSI